MAKRKLSKVDCERIAEMRESGKSYGQIAAAFKCSTSVISWHCLRLGAEPPWETKLQPNYHLERPVIRRGNHIVRAFTPAEDEKLLELSLQGFGESKIGREIGRKPNSVRGRLMTLARRDERLSA